MNNFKILLFAVLCISLFNKCTYKEEWKTFQDGNFQLELPDYLEKMESLSQNTPFQYGNQFRNFYLIVEQFDKAEKQNDLSKYAAKSIHDLLAAPHLSNPDTIELTQTFELNGLKGQHLQLQAKVGSDRINEIIDYNILHLEGKQHYYQLVVWTWNKWNEKYAEVVPKIIESFAEKNDK